MVESELCDNDYKFMLSIVTKWRYVLVCGVKNIDSVVNPSECNTAFIIIFFCDC